MVFLTIADDKLEDVVTCIMEDSDVIIQNGDIDSWGIPQNQEIWMKISSTEPIVWFVSHSYCQKALINQRNLININSEMKCNISKNN